MHGTTRTRPQPRPAATGASAVVWIAPGRALAVRGRADDRPAELDLAIPSALTAAPAVLAELAHWIGDVDRVVILGSDDLRIALEREIVAIGHRPDTIREAVAEGPVDTSVLVARLRRLV